MSSVILGGIAGGVVSLIANRITEQRRRKRLIRTMRSKANHPSVAHRLPASSWPPITSFYGGSEKVNIVLSKETQND